MADEEQLRQEAARKAGTYVPPSAPRRLTRHFPVPVSLTSTAQLATLIQQLEALQAEAADYPEFQVIFQIED